MAFQLFDPRQRFAAWRPRRIPDDKLPRIWVPSNDTPPGTLIFRPEDLGKSEPPPKDDSIDATRLARRLQALELALADLPRQARRLVRLRMKRQKSLPRTGSGAPSLTLKSPLRPGRPPGYRKKPAHEVDDVLKECHALC